MNPYLAAAIAMCGITLIALAATAYLAVMFNRRAKADLSEALTPLAALTDGETDIDEAVVRGRYAGHIVEGRMANAADGRGRIFRTDLVDAAGGIGWQLTSTPSRRPGESVTRQFESADPALEASLATVWNEWLPRVADLDRERLQLDYDPDSARLSFSRPMRTRRDIPTVEAFRDQLDLLAALGRANRRAQDAPDADSP